MDKTSDEKCLKICYKLSHHLYESLNVVHCSTHSLTVLWNKYQILVYDDLKLEESPKVLEPEFNISKLLICNNYLICLDDSGNVHNISLKFKHTAQKRLKASFQPREQNIIGIKCVGDYIYALKLVSNTYYIYKYKNNLDFQLEAQVALEKLKPSDPKPPIFYLYLINELEFETIKGFFKIDQLWKQHVLFLISIDRLSLWAALCSNKSNEESINVLKLYNTPSEISDLNIIKYDHLNILIALKIGTIIKIPLITPVNPDVVHLNIAIHKLLVISNTIIYSDCNTLWKCEKVFKKDQEFKQLFVKNIRDFILIDNLVLCTTYTNLIYSCMINDDTSYLESATAKYCPADKVLSNSNCLINIMKEIEKSDKIISKINEKKKYITTLALSNRQDVMGTLINYNVVVYEKFEDICKENITLSIIDNIKEYYDENSIYFFIKIATSALHNNYNELLSNLSGNLKMHLILKTKEKILKTVSLTLNGLKKINIVIPIKTVNDTFYKINVAIKLLTEIPGVFESKQSVWTTLHKKNIVLHSENFIKTYRPSNFIRPVNEESWTVDDLIYKTTIIRFGHLFKFNKTTKGTISWSLYLNLPENFDKVLKNESYFKDNVDTPKALSIGKQLKEELLQSKSELFFNINNEKVKLEIVNDGFTKPSLKTSSENLEIAIDIKNFMSKLIYNDFREMEPEKEFVDQALYTTVEYLEKSIDRFMKKDSFETKEFMNLFEQYQKTVRSFLLT